MNAQEELTSALCVEGTCCNECNEYKALPIYGNFGYCNTHDKVINIEKEHDNERERSNSKTAC